MYSQILTVLMSYTQNGGSLQTSDWWGPDWLGILCLVLGIGSLAGGVIYDVFFARPTGYPQNGYGNQRHTH